jgi:hypothetical protein
MRHGPIFFMAVAFTLLFGVLTLWALFTYGPRPLELISLLVLALLVYGILGALLRRPED